MLVAEDVATVRSAIREARAGGKSIGFVPTMGALHVGHVSLMTAARSHDDFVVASIFVNPTQFAPHEDLSRYPRPRERDLDICREAGVDLVFYPPVDEMYGPGASTFVTVEGLTDAWEGAVRPGHFRGVTTVVAKLFAIVPADRAYFGQKDYQQQAVIRKMAADLKLSVEIHTCPTIRDADGLALSSRNAYLSADERTAGLCLSQALRRGEQLVAEGASPLAVGEAMRALIAGTPGTTLDYASVVDPDTLVELRERQPEMVALVACRVGTTRLIDNAVWRS